MNGSSLQAVGLAELFHGGQDLFRLDAASSLRHVARCDAALFFGGAAARQSFRRQILR